MPPPTSSVVPEDFEQLRLLAHRGAMAEVVLRVLLFIGSLTAVVVMVTSKQTGSVPAFGNLRTTARFTDTPAFVYFVAAHSTAGLYSIITAMLSISALSKLGYSKTSALYIVLVDLVMLGIVATALGTAGGVAYVGFRGNFHTGWAKVCNTFDKYCQHSAGAIVVSLFAATVLLLLILRSVFTMYRQIPK